MLKQKYFLTDIFILSTEKQPIKLSWRKIEWLRRNDKIYNLRGYIMSIRPLWFDVEMIRYTTIPTMECRNNGLWFDVEMIRYTTMANFFVTIVPLWFDVEMIRYTTAIPATEV